MTRRALFLSYVPAVVALIVLAACGGGSPMESSSARGILVRGALSGDASAQSGASSAAAVTVRVLEEPSVSTTVAADGSFTLRGLPLEGFTLVFSEAQAEVGRLRFDGVASHQEITIRVKITSSGVRLLEERRDGIGHGDLEIEGRVASVVAANPRGDSRFIIAGYTVVARFGHTTIRKNDAPATVLDVAVGDLAQVKGEWIPTLAASSPQEVLAHEMNLHGN